MKHKDIYATVTPVYYAAKIFGISPYILNRGKATTEWRVYRLGMFQAVIHLLLLAAAMFPCIKYQREKILTQVSDVISIYSDIFKMASSNITAIIATVLALTNRHTTCELMNNLADFDMELKRLGITVEHTQMYKSITLAIALSYAFLITILTADFVLFTKVTSDILTNVYWFLCIFFFIIIATAIAQLLCFMFLIYKRYKVINSFIMNLSNNENEPKAAKPSWIKVNPLKSKNQIGDITGKSLKLLKFITVLPSNKGTVNVLCEMHDKLCNLTKILNSMYSIIILVITGTAFVVLVTHLYFFYLMFSGNKNYELTYDKAWNSAIWGVIYFVIIFIISFACSKTKEEADDTGILLHRMNTDIRDEDTRTSVEMFSLQMLHQKVEFSACGFFPVDFTVIYMIIGAVTTYLVFLIQFEMTGRSLSHE